MKVIIKGNPQEIAALVLAVQERQGLDITGADVAREIRRQWDSLRNQIESDQPSL